MKSDLLSQEISGVKDFPMIDPEQALDRETTDGLIGEIDSTTPGVNQEASLFLRQERKYLVSLRPVEDVMKTISSYVPIYRYSGKHDVTNIRTTYFDSPGLNTYREYIQRRKIRRKIRMRQYGYNGQFDPVSWLELKVKDHGISKKERFCLLEDDLPEFLAGKDVLDRVREMNTVKGIDQIYLDVRAILSSMTLMPLLQVRYDRISFQQQDDNGFLRVTLDQNLTFELLGSEAQYTMDVVVMEVKVTGERPAWLPELFEKIGAKRVKRFSKFANAVEYLSSIPRAAQFLAGGLSE